MIDYDKIDKKCISMVKFFNEQGLTTKFSCQGHDDELRNQFDIIFADDITDENIYNFVDKFSNQYQHSPFIGKFNKWMRKMNGKIVYNWCYTVAYGDSRDNQEYANSDLEIMIKQLNGH